MGVPFSDPLADGPEIQRSSERALKAGATLRGVLNMVGVIRKDVAAPLVLFSYANPVVRFGVEAFAARAAEVGVDGVLLLDLPLEEAGPTRDVLVGHGLAPIFLVSPTTTGARVRKANDMGKGFLYAISRLGVTGVREQVAGDARALVDRLRQDATCRSRSDSACRGPSTSATSASTPMPPWSAVRSWHRWPGTGSRRRWPTR